MLHFRFIADRLARERIRSASIAARSPRRITAKSSIFGNTAVATQNVALPPFIIGSLGSGNQETVTSYTVSGCSNPNQGASQAGTCQISATFTYAHGRGDLITSADSGWQEAMNDASNNGGGPVAYQIDCGVITLSTVRRDNYFYVPDSERLHQYGCVGSRHDHDHHFRQLRYRYFWRYGCVYLGLYQLNCRLGLRWLPGYANQCKWRGRDWRLADYCGGGTAGAGAVHIKVWGVSQAQSSF